MSLLSLVVTLIVIGLILWAINVYLPIDAKIKKVINVVVVICVAIWLLNAFGIWGHAKEVPVPKL
jgi:hypothetical protein